MAVDKKIHLVPLSDKEAWDLFVSNSGEQILDPEIKNIAKEILYECGGSSDHYHDNMSCNERSENLKFDPRELIRYWMAENLIHNQGGIVESINDGLEIPKELKDANMMEIFMEGGIEWLKIHDLFRDLGIVIMRVELDFFVEAGVGLHYFDGTRKKKLSLIRNQIYHLNLRTMNTLQNPCINMSTLLLKDNPLYQISYSFFSSMPNLEVLDMSFSVLKELPPSFSELPKLQVLLLEFCTTLEKLPPLGNLKALLVLSLRGTLIKELLQGIKGLVNRIFLDLSETIKLSRIEAGAISLISKLEELQLQGSLLCMMESPMVANLFKEISCLKLLGILTVSAVGLGNPLDMVLHLQQHNLRTFSVSAYESTLDYMDDE